MVPKMPNEAWLAWHYARRALPGYAELDNAQQALNHASARAEIEPDSVLAIQLVTAAYERWCAAYRAWHPAAQDRIPR